MSAQQNNSTVPTPLVSSSIDQTGTSNGSSFVSFGMPGNAGIAERYGAIFAVRTATAVAPVAALPTTASHFSLQNGETIGTTKCYIILSVHWTTIVSAGAAFVGQLLVHNSPVPTSTAITGTAASAIKCVTGKAFATNAVALSAVTITNDGLWHPLGNSVNAGAATATIALGQEAVCSDYIVRPGGVFSAAVLCSAAGSATCDITIKWAEVNIIAS